MQIREPSHLSEETHTPHQTEHDTAPTVRPHTQRDNKEAVHHSTLVTKQKNHTNEQHTTKPHTKLTHEGRKKNEGSTRETRLTSEGRYM